MKRSILYYQIKTQFTKTAGTSGSVTLNQINTLARIYPVTKEQQENFLAALEAPNSDRFALLIKPKDVATTVGVVSLSSINLQHKHADTALILSSETSKYKDSIFFALEQVSYC